jgi:uncharacterized membrane protein YdfJ with MMPL/SSD domain
MAIGSSLVVNLAFVPALLCTRVGAWMRKNESMAETISRSSNEHAMALLEGGPGMILERITARVAPKSVWYSMSKVLLHPYQGIIVLLLVIQLLAPVARHAFHLKSTLAFDLFLPGTSPALGTYYSLGDKFGMGKMHPYEILFDGRSSNTTITCAYGFQIMHLVVDELMTFETQAIGRNSMKHFGMDLNEARLLSEHIGDVDREEIDLTEDHDNGDEQLMISHQKRTVYTGVAVLRNAGIPHSLYLSAKYCSKMKPYCPLQLLHTLDAIDKSSTSEDSYSTVMSATLGVNPFSDDGRGWLDSARETLQRMEDRGALGGINVSIDGAAASERDAMSSVYTDYPKVIAITVLIVLSLLGAIFCSLFLPFRSLVSVSMTLGFSFGMGVLTFQNGILDWTGVQVFAASDDEVCWMVPVMAFSVIVGIALVFDVLLVSRILEYRCSGYAHKSSIAVGLHSSGGFLTATGLLLALAFGSLMLTSYRTLHQFSFLITSAVLFDTFVVRTIVAPILISFAGNLCWWPRRMPSETIRLEFDGDTDDLDDHLRNLEGTSEYEPIMERPREC